jgi:hypothetical protein
LHTKRGGPEENITAYVSGPNFRKECRCDNPDEEKDDGNDGEDLPKQAANVKKLDAKSFVISFH